MAEVIEYQRDFFPSLRKKKTEERKPRMVKWETKENFELTFIYLLLLYTSVQCCMKNNLISQGLVGYQ